MLEVMLCGAVDTSEVRDGFVDVVTDFGGVPLHYLSGDVLYQRRDRVMDQELESHRPKRRPTHLRHRPFTGIHYLAGRVLGGCRGWQAILGVRSRPDLQPILTTGKESRLGSGSSVVGPR